MIKINTNSNRDSETVLIAYEKIIKFEQNVKDLIDLKSIKKPN